ncbi:hypothetical protein [Haloparvum sedimenti]|uniref:hypothetical protein n=1 Tax=Haloparvum sedimenti TaxID=1678448 RepID=UPI00071E9BAF|nr:hypothetical protein [Haloparvum sedimenti]
MSNLVNTLGLIAGSVWVCAAIWYELIYAKQAHPHFVLGSFLLGSGIIMGSAALALTSPTLIETFAIVSNLVFLVLGIGTWYYIAFVEEPPTADDLTERSHEHRP